MCLLVPLLTWIFENMGDTEINGRDILMTVEFAYLLVQVDEFSSGKVHRERLAPKVSPLIK